MIDDHWKPSETIGNHWKPLDTIGNHWKPLETIGNHWKPWEWWEWLERLSKFGQSHFDPCSSSFFQAVLDESAISWWIFIREVLKLLINTVPSSSLIANDVHGTLSIYISIGPPKSNGLPFKTAIKLAIKWSESQISEPISPYFTRGAIAVTWTIATPHAKRGWELWTRHPGSRVQQGSPGVLVWSIYYRSPVGYLGIYTYIYSTYI